ncbi:MAG: group II intron reverse transcriptase/maturase [bacterium]|nr:group II intron reverse transcriptase/maturase [bacterium]
MPFATAERSRPGRDAEGAKSPNLIGKAARKVPKAELSRSPEDHAWIERVVQCLPEALAKVVKNRGAPGPDRKTVEDVQQHWSTIGAALCQTLLDGTYQPGQIRRVWIPKSGGKLRGLGIPNVVDRVVQEAVRQVLEPVYEPTFHDASHGFRPRRGCQTAIRQAVGYVEGGRHWVVDMDLEKFFDRVHHQRLLSRLAQRVEDRRLVKLIGRMLKAGVVMPDGVKVATDEGVPQGGPLSPLLSNIVLDELDWELERRGHRFVRYADDCNVYVRSERAGTRVMASVVLFINKRLRLQVNASKSAVARPETRHFLGYRMAPMPDGSVEILLSERSMKRLKERIVELVPRSRGWSLDAAIAKVNRYLRGWMGHFRVCTQGINRVVGNADAHIRRRLRARILKMWKRKRTIARQLIRLGIKPKSAWGDVYEGRKSLWRLSHVSAVDRGLNNAFFRNAGLFSLLRRFQEIWTEVPRTPTQLGGT